MASQANLDSNHAPLAFCMVFNILTQYPMRPFCRKGTDTYNWTNATEHPSDFHPFVGDYGLNNWDVQQVTSLELMFSDDQHSPYQAGGGIPGQPAASFKRITRVDTGAEVHDGTGAEVDNVEWCATDEDGFAAAEAAGKPCDYENVDYYGTDGKQGIVMKKFATMDSAFDMFDYEWRFDTNDYYGFNDAIGGWNTGSVTSMRLAFVGMAAFNQARAFVCGLPFCILAVFVFCAVFLLFGFVLRAAACLNCAVGHMRLLCCCAFCCRCMPRRPGRVGGHTADQKQPQTNKTRGAGENA